MNHHYSSFVSEETWESLHAFKLGNFHLSGGNTAEVFILETAGPALSQAGIV